MVTTRKRQKLEHVKLELVKQEEEEQLTIAQAEEKVEEKIEEKVEEKIKTKTKTKAKTKVKEEVEAKKPELPRYVHPNPYEFKGRLGYACINMYLRNQKPPVFSARTCRIATIKEKGLDYVKGLALLNIEDMKKMIQWNEENHIKFMRMSSEIFPLASHETAGYSIEFAKDALKSAGDLANKYGHRLTMHPGQYNQLVSLTPRVVDNTIRELDYHAEMMDLMGLPADSIMIIHMGGVYGDKASAIERFENVYNGLSDRIKRRLTLENDEFGYSVDDLLPVCKKLKIPLVLDWHHHHLNRGNVDDLLALLPEINKTWTDKGIKPKQHYSESRYGAITISQQRAHSDRVKFLPPTTDDVDLMIEAKDKEQAVFDLYKLYNLQPVNEEVYIKPNKFETTETKGKKSHKKKKE